MIRSLLFLLVVLALVACGGEPTPTPDTIATDVAHAQAVAATLTAAGPTVTEVSPTAQPPTVAPPTDTQAPPQTPTSPPTEPPTPTLTNTPKPPTVTPSSTPTRTPTPTPTKTPTPIPCALAPGGSFAPVWQAHKERLGCAVNERHTTWSAVERFEHGWMYWREDMDRIYAMYNAGLWQDYPNTWQEGEPESAGLTPPPGLYEPIRGFGKLWRLTLGGPASTIGWATEEERGVYSDIQDFAAGIILEVDGKTYVLFRDNGSWAQY